MTCDPYIYKTNVMARADEIVNGIPENTFVRAVREDPKKRGCFTPAPRLVCFVSSMTAQLARAEAQPAYYAVHDLV